MSSRKITESQEQPSTARRAVLTGGALSLAAAAGATLGRGQPADALTTTPSITDWINVVTDVTPGADPTGATDSTSAIQAAINQAASGNGKSQVVYMPSGTYLVSSPLIFGNTGNSGVCLYGAHGAAASGDGAGGDYGSVIKMSSTFAAWPGTQPTLPGVPGSSGTGWTVPGNWSSAVIACLDSAPGTTGGPIYAFRFRDFWIDCQNATRSYVDGMTFFGAIKNCIIENVGVFSATGNGMGFYQDMTASYLQPYPDGFSISTCMLESVTGTGFAALSLADSQMINVHAQSGSADGFSILGGNNFFVACRGDNNSGNGFTVDATPGGKYDGCVVLVGCGTEANDQNGLSVTDSSSDGSMYHAPVVVTGCSFDGDGVSGSLTPPVTEYAGISVAGLNAVSIANTRVMMRTADNSGGCPQVGLATAVGATGKKPTSVVMSSGFLGYSGTVPVNDVAGVGANLIISPNVTSAQGLHPTTLIPFPLTLNGSYTTFGAAIAVTNTSTPSGTPIGYDAAAAGDAVLGVRVTTDANARWQFDSNGKMQWGSGGALADVKLQRSSANTLSVLTADLDINSTGRGLQVAEGNGSNAKQGTETLVGGTCTVTNSAVTASSRIFLTAQDNNTTGALRVSARTANSQFTITSSSTSDHGLVAYEIFEPG